MSKRTDKIVDDYIRDLKEENELLRAVLKRHLTKGCEVRKEMTECVYNTDDEPYTHDGYE